MANVSRRPLTIDQATKPTDAEPSQEDQAWHDEQTRQAIKEADAGDLAKTSDVKATIRKYVPHD